MILYSEQQLELLSSWYKDPIKFINDCVKMQHPVHGMITIQPNDDQKRLLSDIHNFKHTVIDGIRQKGCTVMLLSYMLWCALFRHDYKIKYCNTTTRNAIEASERFKYMYQALPEWIRTESLIQDNKTSKIFVNGVHIMFDNTDGNSGRGFSLDLVIADNFGYSKDQTNFLTCIMPTLVSSSKSKIVLCSTHETPCDLTSEYGKILYDAETHDDSIWRYVRI